MNISHSYLQMDTKLQHKTLFKLWIERKGVHSNIKSEYGQDSVIDMHGYFCV
jgi:hypothetical protein